MKYYRIRPKAKIPKSTVFHHNKLGVVIGSGVKLGENCHIWHNVTIGSKESKKDGMPIIGNNVYIYHNSSILGNIKIGDNVVIGCHSLVLNDIEFNKRVAGIPAKTIKS